MTIIATHHITQHIDFHRIKAAFTHTLRKLLRAGFVRIGHVGHGELAKFLEARITVNAERFMPIPQFITQLGLLTKLIVQTNLCNAMNIAQALMQLKIWMSTQSTLKCCDDLLARKPRAAWPAHSEDEGPTEFIVVVGVELLELFKLLRRAIGQARFALLIG